VQIDCIMLVKSIGVKKSKSAPGVTNSIPGQVEKKIERASAVWKRRCQGATMNSLAIEFGISITTVYKYIEEIRKELREATIDLAVEEREQALALLDTAIEQVMPHIAEGELIKIRSIRAGKRGPLVITIEEYDARMKAAQTLARTGSPTRQSVDSPRMSVPVIIVLSSRADVSSNGGRLSRFPVNTILPLREESFLGGKGGVSVSLL
jgi:hypothetical protein